MGFCSKCGEIIRVGVECPCGEGIEHHIVTGMDGSASAKADLAADAYLSSGLKTGVEGLSRMHVKEAKLSSGTCNEVCFECSRKLVTSDDIFIGPEAGGGHCYCVHCYSYHFKKGDCRKCRQAVLGLGKEYVVSNNEFWHKECYEKDGKVCHVCSKVIFGKGLEALSKSYHPDCFNCFNCQEKITGPFLDWDGDACCNGCYDKIKDKRPEINKKDSGKKNEFVDYAHPQPQNNNKINLDNSLKCDYCLGIITNFAGSPDIGVKLSSGKTIHSRCFTCAVCKKVITDGKFCTDGDKSLNYHSACKQSITMLSGGSRLVCSGCTKTITGSYLKNDSDFFHSECFNCTQCRTNLSGVGYLEDPVTKKQVCENCHQKTKKVVQEKVTIVPSGKPFFKSGLKDAANSGAGYLLNFGKEKCPACDKQLFPMDNKTEGPFATLWHKSCLKCNKCNKQLDSAAKMKGVLPHCAMCFL